MRDGKEGFGRDATRRPRPVSSATDGWGEVSRGFHFKIFFLLVISSTVQYGTSIGAVPMSKDKWAHFSFVTRIALTSRRTGDECLSG